METRLYIGNLPQEMTAEDLRTMFSEAGTVEEVDLVIDHKSGKPRGFAFVTMNSQEEAEKATAQFNAKEVMGRMLKVNITLPREIKPATDTGTGPNKL
jgi:RNA recognition motif-containing protein